MIPTCHRSRSPPRSPCLVRPARVPARGWAIRRPRRRARARGPAEASWPGSAPGPSAVRRVLAPTTDRSDRPARRRRERAALRQPGRAGHSPAPGRPRLHVHRRRRAADPFGARARANPRARDPAGVDGRLDLPAPGRPHPGDRARCARAPAVPLPRGLPGSARPREVRAPPPVRRAPPADPASGPAGPPPSGAAAGEGPRGRRGAPGADAAARGRRGVCAPESLVRAVDACGTGTPRVTGTTVRFRFRGKGGRTEERELVDRRLAALVRRCQELPGQDLFQYIDDEGEARAVRSEDVNDYLREAAGSEDVSAKDFRTWTATVLAFEALRQVAAEEAEQPGAGARREPDRGGPPSHGGRARRHRRGHPQRLRPPGRPGGVRGRGARRRRPPAPPRPRRPAGSTDRARGPRAPATRQRCKAVASRRGGGGGSVESASHLA